MSAEGETNIDILIQGGGIGGLTLAIALLQKDYTVRVVERASGLSEIGAGIWMAANPMQVFDRLGFAHKIAEAGWMVHRITLQDYNGAIALDQSLGDAYVSRAGVLVAMKRYDEARSDISEGLALNATNLHAAYYTRAVIEEENGDVQAAYRDYKAALAIKPDSAPASRELSRFKVVRRSARA